MSREELEAFYTKYGVSEPTPEGCRLWTGIRCKARGLGLFHVRSRAVSAQRTAFMLVHGPLPPSARLEHTCGNKLCVLPEPGHLVRNVRPETMSIDQFRDKFTTTNSDGCWLFTSNIGPHGYSLVHWYGYPTRAHRVAYMIANGPIPDGAFILHSCDVRNCCNPAHLRAGTQMENMADKVKRGRCNIPKAEANKNSKVNEAIVRAVCESSLTYRELAPILGISMTTISGIRNGARWAHLTAKYRKSSPRYSRVKDRR